jgi:DNA processing protein
MTYNQTSKYSEIILQLSLIDRIGPSIISKLTNNFTIDKTNLLSFKNYELNDFLNLKINIKIATSIIQELRNNKLLETELNLIQKYNVFVISPFDDEYPKILKTIENIPPILYIKSKSKNIFKNRKVLACIGSRNSNNYGEYAAKHFILNLKEQSVIIASGGAIGGDSFAHNSALNNNIPTIVILGSGLMHEYPASNKYLFEKIVDSEGALISQFPMNTKPNKGTFPARNIVLAGLCDALLVLQAGLKSGTRITAQAALEFGREVGVVPGMFDDYLSIGCNALIKEGAKLIDSSEDLFEMLNINSNKSTESYLQKHLEIDNLKTNQKMVPPNLDKLGKAIFENCHEKKSFDELLIMCSCSVEQLHEKLFEMMTMNIIKQDIMGLWKRN